ncbi:hypothetical protein [Zavarzinia aquatilis]|uniref:Uncharacterized protein n=1 Tax=Zavarzinia aquatilis TaxID=2211142 RepID=A0A317DTX1_9PROT|nr:hypothetical protein [Zavarzinia aquatilis]PWR18138.1 hypothetical protein DKG74_20050 [Zavarzinia aquatilis]
MSQGYVIFASLAVPALCLSAGAKGLFAGASATPPLDLELQVAPTAVAIALSVLAGWGIAAVLAPRGWALALALPGLGIAAAAGPAEALLCLGWLVLGLAILRLAEGQELTPLIGAGLALGALPLVHPAGHAFTLVALPLLAACLPAPLIVGRAAAGAFLLLGLPALGLPLIFTLLAWSHVLPDFELPMQGQGGRSAPSAPGIAAALLIAALPLLPLGPDERGRRLATCALLVLPIPAVLLQGLGGSPVSAAMALAPAFTAAGLIETRRPAVLLALVWGAAGLAVLAPGGW